MRFGKREHEITSNHIRMLSPLKGAVETEPPKPPDKLLPRNRR
jgi:hypothetical protein